MENCFFIILLGSFCESIDFSYLIEFYNSDLPCPELFEQEFVLWKQIFESKDSTDVPSTCSASMKQCDQKMFPSIHVLLKIACTIPVTACECERNANTIRCLHNLMDVE